ncbi:MAG: glycosyltransferase family 4 protein, partial [Euryarchaeota archaeon]
MASAEGAPLRVLIVHVWFWPHVGGGNQHVEMLGRELVKLGHEVTVWCADVPEHEEKQFQRGGINVVRLSPSRVLAGVDPVVSLEGLSMDEFDIVHLHDTLPILIRKSLKMARNAGVPVVTTYHNDYIKNGFIANSIKSIRWSMQGKKTLHSSDARIVLTQYFEKLLRSKGVKGHIDIIPNGFSAIDEDAEKPSTLGELGDRKLLTFVGRLSEQKGLDVLMDAWDLIAQNSDPGFDLAIAGKGELGDWLTERVEKSGQKHAIHRLGLVTEGEKRWLLENSTGVVIPSRFEGLPTVMLEAMYANAPVIMADVNDLGRLVTEPKAGFSVEAGNSVQLADT